MKGVTILGSTGSIGKSTLDVLARHPDQYRVIALTANRDVDTLFEQVIACKPLLAVMADAPSAAKLKIRLQQAGSVTRVAAGVAALSEAAAHPEAKQVMAAIVGAAGLEPTLAAVTAGKTVLLANKEALVVAGELFMNSVRDHGAVLLPIDSEHNAIFQCLPDNFDTDETTAGVDRILLTASGGPFRTWSAAQLVGVTPDQACAHPNWDMGRKISVDSATMMNKGLEVIEAKWLFGLSPDKIQVVVHPQSVVHSMVQYRDGSVLAQMGNPDMRTPIAHALAWPARIDAGVAPLNLFDVARLDFEEPDFSRFRCLELAYQAASDGGTAPAVLNAANEIAVQAFLDLKIEFLQIPEIIDQIMQSMPAVQEESIEQLLAVDAETRTLTEQLLEKRVH